MYVYIICIILIQTVETSWGKEYLHSGCRKIIVTCMILVYLIENSNGQIMTLNDTSKIMMTILHITMIKITNASTVNSAQVQ